MIELPELPVPVVAPSTLVTTASGTFGPLFTADQMRAFARQAVAEAMERAAQIADKYAKRDFTWGSENSDRHHAQADWAELIAAAIRKETL